MKVSVKTKMILGGLVILGNIGAVIISISLLIAYLFQDNPIEQIKYLLWIIILATAWKS